MGTESKRSWFVWLTPLGDGGGVVHIVSPWHCAKEQSASSYTFDQYLKANKRLPKQLVCALYVGRGKGDGEPPPLPLCFNMCLPP